jgi:glycosyltransferase involved in cell wall biosynthesis
MRPLDALPPQIQVAPAVPPGRVLISINTSWNVYNFRASLIKALIAAGHEVIAAAPPDDYSQKLDELGCRFVPLPMDNKGTSPVNDLALLARYWRLFRHERPDIFLGYTVKPNVYGSIAARALGIATVNNISGLGTAFIKDSWLTHIVKRLYRIALARSHAVFFQNHEDLGLFVREGLVDRRRALLLPGSGIDLEVFRPQTQTDSTDVFRFLLIARLLWDKGIGEYVEAARIVRAQVPNATFQLLGFLDVENRTAVDRASVESWVSEGLIEYLGVTEDVRPFIAAADCVVLPSYREGMPRTLLEAAAMGKPLIATDVPGCRQIVEDGRNGLLCQVRDAGDLAAKMLAMLGLPAERRVALGQASRARAEREFDERIVVGSYLKVIETILREKQAV